MREKLMELIDGYYGDSRDVDFEAEVAEFIENNYEDVKQIMEEEGKLPISKKRVTMSKQLCGSKEECFKHGGGWGHLGSVLCKHLSEHNETFFCKHHQKEINHKNVYNRLDQHEKLVGVTTGITCSTL